MEQLKEHAKKSFIFWAVIVGRRYSEYGDPLILEQYLKGEVVEILITLGNNECSYKFIPSPI